MNKLSSVNPYNQKIISVYAPDSLESVRLKITRSWEGHLKWRGEVQKVRKKFLLNCALQLLENKDFLSKLISLEMGKLINESLIEIDKCVALCRYYADVADSFFDYEEIGVDESDAHRYVAFQPLGIILGVMPWNFPFWQVFRFAIPSLISGNTVLLKHASNVTGCALEIEKIFIAAGLANYEFQTLILESSRIEEVVSDFRVKAISLTGSEAAGRSVGALAGKYIKKTVMELGSNDAFIVLSDADVEVAAQAAAGSRLINNGQSCIAAKRFIVVEEVYEEFVSVFARQFSQLISGDPMISTTTLGPLARIDLKDELKKQIEISVNMGTAVTKFGNDDQNDAFVAPTILFDPPKDSPAYKEELFGPVAVIFKVKNLSEAIKLANDSLYGLGASVWTHNENAIEKCVRELSVGSVFVNNIVYSHSAMPFGGVNNSGFGRELGRYGIREFVNVKSVVIKQKS